jgi:Ca2+-binding EF-hand superfamily protein
MEANSVLSGYSKTSEFARKKVSASILSLNQQEQLCDYYLGVLSNIDSKENLSKKYNPDDCSRMIAGWQSMESQMASPAAAVDASIQDLKAKKEDFSSLHNEIVGKLKGLQVSWLQYALSDPASLDGFAKDIFNQVDADKSGQLEFHEVQNFMKVFLTSLGGFPPSNEEIHAMFLKYDTDGSGKLSYIESLEMAKDILKALIAKSENKPSVGTVDPAKNILTN